MRRTTATAKMIRDQDAAPDRWEYTVYDQDKLTESFPFLRWMSLSFAWNAFWMWCDWSVVEEPSESSSSSSWLATIMICLLAIVIVLQYNSFQTSIVRESVVYVEDLGIQLLQYRRKAPSSNPIYREFIDCQEMQDVFLHEVICSSKNRVHFLLFFSCISINHPINPTTPDHHPTTKLVVAFQHFHPSIQELQYLYNQIA